MTGGGGPDPRDDLVPGGLAALFRTAVLLTADTDLALGLVAGVLARRDDPDDLHAQVVRAYLRTAPRRPDVHPEQPRPGRDADAYDVLRALRPRARAATVLRVALGRDLDATAAAVGVSPRRVTAQLPGVPGLERALEALAEQHRLDGADLLAGVRDSQPLPRPDRPGQRRRRLLAAAGTVVALAAWPVLAHDDIDALDDVADAEDTDGTDFGDAGGPTPAGGRPGGLDGADLTAYGWHLDEQGQPPVVAMGLQRQTVIEVPYSAPAQDATWDAGHLLPGGPAAYAVLWCDLPPTDPRIEQPSARLVTGSGTVDLPCAGRDGDPPVQRVAPVPVVGPGRVQLVGDLPREGAASLALYREGALSATLPLPAPAVGEAPPVPGGAVPVDTVVLPEDWDGDTRLVASVTVSAGTEVRVWAGRTGSIGVRVDGHPVTDDGDLDDAPGWRGQEPDLRHGRWVVYRPGTQRVFPLPGPVSPEPGRTRTVTVEVLTRGMGEDARVVLTRAEPAPAGPGTATELPSGTAALTPFAARAEGYRLLGAWSVPQDGLAHDLHRTARPGPAPDDGDDGGGEAHALPSGTELVAFTGTGLPVWSTGQDGAWGLVQRAVDGGEVVTALPLAPGEPDPDAWAAHRLDPWRVQQDLTVPPPPGTRLGNAAARVRLPALPGHPAATVLALDPVEPSTGSTDDEPAPPADR